MPWWPSVFILPYWHNDLCSLQTYGHYKFLDTKKLLWKPWTTHDNALRWGVKKLVDRLREDELKPFFVGLFPKVCRTAFLETAVRRSAHRTIQRMCASPSTTSRPSVLEFSQRSFCWTSKTAEHGIKNILNRWNTRNHHIQIRMIIWSYQSDIEKPMSIGWLQDLRIFLEQANAQAAEDAQRALPWDSCRFLFVVANSQLSSHGSKILQIST